MLPSVILNQVVVDGYVRFPDRPEIIPQRKAQRLTCDGYNSIKILRCFTLDIPPLRLLVEDVDLLPPAYVPEALAFKGQLNGSLLVDDLAKAVLGVRLGRVGGVSGPCLPDTLQSCPRPDQIEIREHLGAGA